VTLALYVDAHVPFAITQGLRQRGVDVLTAQEDDADTLDDPQLLERAGELNRVVFSFDQDFSQLTGQWQSSGRSFAGVITLRRWRLSLR
jgi:predicted nuclease of predicted toxin-antitoxin system